MILGLLMTAIIVNTDVNASGIKIDIPLSQSSYHMIESKPRIILHHLCGPLNLLRSFVASCKLSIESRCNENITEEEIREINQRFEKTLFHTLYKLMLLSNSSREYLLLPKDRELEFSMNYPYSIVDDHYSVHTILRPIVSIGIITRNSIKLLTFSENSCYSREGRILSIDTSYMWLNEPIYFLRLQLAGRVVKLLAQGAIGLMINIPLYNDLKVNYNNTKQSAREKYLGKSALVKTALGQHGSWFWQGLEYLGCTADSRLNELLEKNPTLTMVSRVSSPDLFGIVGAALNIIGVSRRVIVMMPYVKANLGMITYPILFLIDKIFDSQFRCCYSKSISRGLIIYLVIA